MTMNACGIRKPGLARRGFTILELMVVISVIAILATLVTKAAQSSIKEAREKEARIMAKSIELGIANFHAQLGEWPPAIEKCADDGKSPSGNPGNPGALSNSDADSVVQRVIKEGANGSPLLDASGLFVATKNVADSSKPGYGIKYGDARRRNVPLENMAFGYQRKRDGVFRRFVIKYDPTNDMVTVSHPDLLK